MNDALKSGSVDAVLTVEPFITRIKNAGNGDVAALYAADLARTDPIISYVASRAFAEQHPDVIKAFRASIEEAAPIVNSDREKASQSIATFTKMPIDLVRLTRPDVSMPELKGSDFDHDNPRLVSHFGEDQEPWRIPSAKLKRPREVISGPPGPPQCGRTIPHTAFTLIKDAERPVLFQPFFNPTGGRVQATRRSKGKSRLRNNSVSGGEDKPRDCGDSVPPRFRPRFPSSLEDARPPSHATLGTLETSCALGLYGGGITSWAPRGQSEVFMYRMLLGASAAALIFAFAHAAFADEAGAVTGGVAGAVGGAAVGGPVGAVVGGVGGAAVGDTMTNHRRYYHGYAYYPYHHHHHHYYGER